jgi:GDP-4-dehydro-6-deoxy-D-mannose reductase
MTRVLVTGGGGFVGQWLVRSLLRRGDDVWAARLDRPAHAGFLEPSEAGAVRWAECDVRDAEAVDRLVALANPEIIFHLAALSLISEAERDREEAKRINVGGGVNIASAAARLVERGQDPVVVIVGSGTQYGSHAVSEMPLPETAEQRPLSVYAITKHAQELATLRIGRERRVRVVCARSFNHSGPGQKPPFFIPSLVSRIKSISQAGGKVSIGNDTVRDYLHVADVVDAYLALAERGKAGEAYNVASGEGIGTRALAAEALAVAAVEAQIVADPQLARGSDILALVGSPAKLQRDTGWVRRLSRADIIRDLLAVS